MFDTDHALRVLHPIPGLLWTEVREAATACARRKWPVLPGTYQLAAESGWLGKRGALDLEPIADPWALSPTTDPGVAQERWTRRPYSVLPASARLEDDHELDAAYFPSSGRVHVGAPCVRQVLRTQSVLEMGRRSR